MKSQSRPNWLVRLAATALLTIIYYGMAEVGRYLASTPQDVTPVWLPDGIALAAVLLLGNWVWSGIFVGSFLANVWAFLDQDSLVSVGLSILKASGIGAGTTLGILLAAYLLHTGVGHRNPFNRAQDTIRFLVVSAMLGPVVNATVGTTVLGMADDVPWSTYGVVWLTWWVSNVTGILIFTPVLLVWGRSLLHCKRYPTWMTTEPFKAAAPQDDRPSYLHRYTGWQAMEALVLMALVLGVGQVAFGIGYPVEYMLIPLLIWAVFRFGQRGATLLILVISAIAILATVHETGSFSQPDNTTTSLLLLQPFIGVMVFITLILTATITERQQTTATLQRSEAELRKQAQQLEQTLNHLRHTQAQLVQTEKISSLGQLIAGVAHEVNNPVSFISGNLNHVKTYMQDLVEMLQLYQQHLPNPPVELQQRAEDVELTYVLDDLPKALTSMQIGAERIREIMSSLRTFSRVDSHQKQWSDVHAGIDSTLLILQHRLKATPRRPAIHLIKTYGDDVPLIECYAGQLNQVFMNLLANAIDALDDYSNQRTYADLELLPNVIAIRTEVMDDNSVAIAFYNNGPSIPENVQPHLFDAFYTTKPAGKGTGLGLSISHQIVVEKHQGQLQCLSQAGWGTEFLIKIPLSWDDSGVTPAANRVTNGRKTLCLV